MPTSYKVLGQSTPSANTITTLYTVPSTANTVVSTVTVCNQGAGNAAISIAVCPANTSVTTSQYIVNNATVVANDTVFLTVGLTLATTDTIRVNSNIANVSFNTFGSEITP
jgi:hypothetical protein